MGLLEDIEAYLITEELATVDGTDIFRNFEPDTPDEVVILNEYNTSPTVVGSDAYTRDVQVVARAKTAAGAETKSRQLFDALVHPIDPIITLTLTREVVISAHQLPLKYRVDEETRVYYAFNLAVTTNSN